MRLHVAAVAIRAADGVVYSLPPPARHCHVNWWLAARGIPLHKCQLYHHGFELSDGRYANRRTARRIAREAGQLLPRAHATRDLFSEDVW